MAESQPIQQAPRQSLKPGQCLLVGRISDVKRTENACYTIIQTPAPDQFSHPGNHEVTSRRMLGKPGEDVQVLVELKGYRRTYKNKHGENVVTVDNVLSSLED